MTTREAQALIDEQANRNPGEPSPQIYFDYVKGRVMKVDLSGDEFSPRLYDRDNGQGAAEGVINALRAKVSAAGTSG